MVEDDINGDSAENGIFLHKVRSHIGINGNEEADKAAKWAAENKTACEETVDIGNKPYEHIYWIGKEIEDEEEKKRYKYYMLPNLKGYVHQAAMLFEEENYEYMHGKRGKGVYLTAVLKVSKDIDIRYAKREPADVETYRQHKTAAKVNWGHVWNKKLAMRYNMAYRRGGPICRDTYCPLTPCNGQDSVGHIMGGCGHPEMKALYIARHDTVVKIIAKCIRKGSLGGNYMIVDAGEKDDNMYNGKRLPEWLLRHMTHAERRKYRPDILLIKNMPPNVKTMEDINKKRHQCIMYVIEVGIVRDTNYEERYNQKETQHLRLKEMLEEEGWTIGELPPMVLGATGTIFKNMVEILQELTITGARQQKAIKKIQDITRKYMQAIILKRREIESRDEGIG
jgi:hypothetical protein